MTDPSSDSTGTNGQGDPDGLGDAGKRAIAAERKRADDAERNLRALQAQHDAATARITQLEQAEQTLTGDVASRDLAITRLNIGLDKGLSRALIDRLQGADEAAITADADALVALFPPPPTGGTTPRPDPTQGVRTAGAATPQQAFEAALGPMLNP